MHLVGLLVKCSNFEGADLHVVNHFFHVDEELLTVPHVVEVELRLLGVLKAGWVAASDEMGDATVGAGGGVPQDFSWTCIVHW